MRLHILFALFLLLGCSYEFKIKTGSQAFELKKYALASRMYISEFSESNSEQQKAEKAYKLGLCFKYISDYGSALKWFRKAYELNYGPPAIWEYASALKNTGEYESAREAYKRFGEETGRNIEARREMNSCNILLEWKNSPGPFVCSIKKLSFGKEFSSEYHAMKLRNSSWVFVKEQSPGTDGGKKNYEWTGRPYSDIFISDSNGTISFSEKINSKANEGAFCFSSEENEIYFTRCNTKEEEYDFCRIFYATRKDESWSTPVQIVFPDSKGNQMHPALNPSERTLIFCSDAPGGYGGFDLYKSELTEDGWSNPKNLGPRVNSTGNEMFPTWFHDTLFYSSNGLIGLGGLDIFKTYQINDTSWAPPVNLKTPFNSEADDFSLIMDSNVPTDSSIYNVAYLSSNRQDNRTDALYQIEMRRRSITHDSIAKKKYSFTLYAIMTFIPSEEYSQVNQFELDSVILKDKQSGSIIDIKSSKSLKLKVLPGQTYQFFIKRNGYLNREIEFTTPVEPVLNKDSIATLNLVYEMVPFDFNKEFVLKSLYFDFDKWDLRSDALASLEELRDLLKTNPRLKVLIGSHTDCRGESEYNYDLSFKRAKSAVDWLVLQGIQNERLLSEGHGESQPAVNCICEQCTEAQHQLNRRCTFRLIP